MIKIILISIESRFKILRSCTIQYFQPSLQPVWSRSQNTSYSRATSYHHICRYVTATLPVKRLVEIFLRKLENKPLECHSPNIIITLKVVKITHKNVNKYSLPLQKIQNVTIYSQHFLTHYTIQKQQLYYFIISTTNFIRFPRFEFSYFESKSGAC